MMAAENEIKLNICYGCMKELEEGQKVCPSCGYDSNAPQNGEDVLPEGTVLSRKYLVGKVLGRGGFGVTYLGYDLDLQLKVAIKEYFPRIVCHRSSQSYNVFLDSGLYAESAFSKGCEVFLEEARTLAKISSPNIVHVRDFFREHRTAYIVMDYVEGITLKAEMKKNGGRLPCERVLSLMEPLIQQLDRLHKKNIIHRDIKPENLMLHNDENGEHLVLLDFGAAREYVTKETRGLTSIVTHGFSPLEQYSSIGPQGPYTDVYALCATFYNAITGIVPPPANDRNIYNVQLKSITESGISIAPDIETAILHGLALRSENRPQTMAQLLEEMKGTIANNNEAIAGTTHNENVKPDESISQIPTVKDPDPDVKTYSYDDIEEKYKKAIEYQKSARTISDYKHAIQEFDKIADYGDCAERIKQCKNSIHTLKKKKTKRLIILCACITAVLFLETYFFTKQERGENAEEQNPALTSEPITANGMNSEESLSQPEQATKQLQESPEIMPGSNHTSIYTKSIIELSGTNITEYFLEKDTTVFYLTRNVELGQLSSLTFTLSEQSNLFLTDETCLWRVYYKNQDDIWQDVCSFTIKPGDVGKEINIPIETPAYKNNLTVKALTIWPQPNYHVESWEALWEAHYFYNAESS